MKSELSEIFSAARRERKINLDRPGGGAIVAPNNFPVRVDGGEFVVGDKRVPLNSWKVQAALGRLYHLRKIEPDQAVGAMIFLGRATWVSPFSLTPPHRAEGKCVRAVKARMKRQGWAGRPLLAAGAKALTGSHRLQAARELGLEVPVIFLDEEEAETAREAISRMSTLPLKGKGFWSLARVLVKEWEVDKGCDCASLAIQVL